MPASTQRFLLQSLILSVLHGIRTTRAASTKFRNSAPTQCVDGSGNVVPCKKSWIPIIVVVSIVAGVLLLVGACWFWRNKCRNREKLGGSQKYKPLGESGSFTAHSTLHIEQHNLKLPYDPPPVSTTSFPDGYVAPEIGYDYKPSPSVTSFAGPLDVDYPPKSHSSSQHATTLPHYDPPPYMPSTVQS